MILKDKHTSSSGSDVGSKSERINSLQRNDPNSCQRSQCGSKDGTGLNEDSHETADKDGQVSDKH